MLVAADVGAWRDRQRMRPLIWVADELARWPLVSSSRSIHPACQRTWNKNAMSYARAVYRGSLGTASGWSRSTPESRRSCWRSRRADISTRKRSELLAIARIRIDSTEREWDYPLERFNVFPMRNVNVTRLNWTRQADCFENKSGKSDIYNDNFLLIPAVVIISRRLERNSAAVNI